MQVNRRPAKETATAMLMQQALCLALFADGLVRVPRKMAIQLARPMSASFELAARLGRNISIVAAASVARFHGLRFGPTA